MKKNFEEIISIDDKKASVRWGMNSSGFLYMKDLEVSGIDLMETIRLSEQGIDECIKIMNRVNNKKDDSPRKKVKGKK